MDETAPRISRVDWNGTPAWLKRVEVLPLRYRIQKGDPQKLFETEKAIYRKLAKLNLPGPEVLDEGPDYMVIRDAGSTLQDILLGDDSDASDAALVRSAVALGALHKGGFAHGRPAPRDICIRDDRVTFLDWEQYNVSRDTNKGYANDLIVFVFFTLALRPGIQDRLRRSCLAYLRKAPPEFLPEVCKRAGRLRIAAKILTPLLAKFDHKPDIAAVHPTLAFLRDEICVLRNQKIAQ